MKPIIKFNSGSGAILCNRCRVIIKDNLTRDEFDGKTNLLFCDKCFEIEFYKWLRLREIHRNDEGRFCYCGHTNRCNCANPDFLTFKDSVVRGAIILNSPTNGWRKLKNNND